VGDGVGENVAQVGALRHRSILVPGDSPGRVEGAGEADRGIARPELGPALRMGIPRAGPV
jgi:hypothetical protein